MSARVRGGRGVGCSALTRVAGCATLAVLGLASVISCADAAEPEPEPTQAQAAQQLCQAMCHAERACELPEVAECEQGCQQNNAAYVERTRPSAVVAEAQCLQTASCEEGLGELVRICNEQVRTELPPTEAHVEFCEALSAPFFECLYFDTPDHCTWGVATYSDAALDSGKLCAQETSCQSFADCLAINLWNYAG